MRAELILAMQGVNLRKGHEAVQRRTSPIVEWPNKTSDGFPWDKVLFGYSISGNIFTVLIGEIHFKDQIYTSDEMDLTIAATDSYVYVEMEWGTGICSIKQDTDKTKVKASDSHFRKWLYQLTYVAPTTVSVKWYGHTGGAISIMPVLT